MPILLKLAVHQRGHITKLPSDFFRTRSTIVNRTYQATLLPLLLVICAAVLWRWASSSVEGRTTGLLERLLCIPTDWADTARKRKRRRTGFLFADVASFGGCGFTTTSHTPLHVVDLMHSACNGYQLTLWRLRSYKVVQVGDDAYSKT